jgi:hypothetical protein
MFHRGHTLWFDLQPAINNTSIKIPHVNQEINYVVGTIYLLNEYTI